MAPRLVVVRTASSLPPHYLPGLYDGMIVHWHDLELLPQHPTKPAIALPTGAAEIHGNEQLPVYEVYALGG